MNTKNPNKLCYFYHYNSYDIKKWHALKKKKKDRKIDLQRIPPMIY